MEGRDLKTLDLFFQILYLLLTVTPIYWVLAAVISKILPQEGITIKIPSAKGIWQTHNIMTIKHQFIAKAFQLSSKSVKEYNYLVFKPRKTIQSDKTTIQVINLNYWSYSNLFIFEKHNYIWTANKCLSTKSQNLKRECS